MNTTNRKPHFLQKGFVFSMDFMLAFVVLLLMAYFCLLVIEEKVSKRAVFLKNTELESSAVFLADSMVKNFDENNSFYGIAFFDSEKHRAKSNEISSKRIVFPDENFSDFFVREISITFKAGGSKILFDGNFSAKNCFSVERFVLFDSKKSKLGVLVCEK